MLPVPEILYHMYFGGSSEWYSHLDVAEHSVESYIEPFTDSVVRSIFEESRWFPASIWWFEGVGVVCVVTVVVVSLAGDALQGPAHLASIRRIAIANGASCVRTVINNQSVCECLVGTSVS